MAKKTIPEELNELIQQYLTDGVLTDKERQVILNEAENLGLNRDKIDLYLDAEIQKLDQQADATVRRQKGRQCPYCGKPIPQLAEKCPHCGEDITVQASEELQEIFEKLEEALVDLKSGHNLEHSKATIERFARKAKMYYGSNPKVQKLLENIEVETIIAEKKAITKNRKSLAFRYLSNKWTLFAIYLLFGPILFLYLSSTYYPSREREYNSKIDLMYNEVQTKYSDCWEENDEGKREFSLDLFQKYYPKEYLNYINQKTPLEDEARRCSHNRLDFETYFFFAVIGAGALLFIIFIRYVHNIK